MIGVKMPGKMGLPDRGMMGSLFGRSCSMGIISVSGMGFFLRARLVFEALVIKIRLLTAKDKV